jgi:hypothetical protein
MNRTAFVWLLAAACVLVFLALEPLLSFSLFGSDTGEYYYLTATLVSTGHFAAQAPAYQGWGTGYPDFPGMFALAGAVSGALGVGMLPSLLYSVPVLGALSVFPVFLLFRRLFQHDLAALLGAAFAGVAMPRMYILAHPAPQALGDLLVVAALWMYVEGRKDRRWYLPLVLTSGALIVTHHLSSYFFLLAALGAVFLLEVWRPGAWTHRFPTRELAFSAAFVVALLAYWFYYAPGFFSAVGIQSFPYVGAPAFIAAGAVAVVLLGIVIYVRRKRTTARGGHAKFPGDRSTVAEMVLIATGTVAGLAILLVVSLPPGNQHVTGSELLYFAPYYLPFLLAAGTRRLLSLSRIGSFAIAWIGVLAISVLVGFANPEFIGKLLIPSRTVEFLAIPLGLLLAVGLGRWIARAQDRAGRPAVVAGACVAVLLLAANAAIIYPPPSDFGGFQEGLTFQDQALWLWGGIGLAPHTTVASDHRLSSMLFGFDQLAATWDDTPALFNGNRWTLAAAELHSSPTPHNQPQVIETVAVDSVMHSGVALDPSNLALPLSPQAAAWLDAPPFVPIYESGPQVIYWVDWGT